MGQAQGHQEPAVPLHKRADGRLSVLPDDEVAFPVSRDGAIGRLRRSVGDHHHVGHSAFRSSAASGSAPGSASPQTGGQFLSEAAPSLDKERLIDGLMRHAHGGIQWVVDGQPSCNLLRRPALQESSLDLASKRQAQAEPSCPRATVPLCRSLLGPDNSVGACRSRSPPARPWMWLGRGSALLVERSGRERGPSKALPVQPRRADGPNGPESFELPSVLRPAGAGSTSSSTRWPPPP